MAVGYRSNQRKLIYHLKSSLSHEQHLACVRCWCAKYSSLLSVYLQSCINWMLRQDELITSQFVVSFFCSFHLNKKCCLHALIFQIEEFRNLVVPLAAILQLQSSAFLSLYRCLGRKYRSYTLDAFYILVINHILHVHLQF